MGYAFLFLSGGYSNSSASSVAGCFVVVGASLLEGGIEAEGNVKSDSNISSTSLSTRITIVICFAIG